MGTSRKDKPHILFVDDEQRVLNSMRVMFRREYELHLTTRPKEALEIIKNEPIDVIVADHRMPEMTGVEVLSRVKTESPRTVRVLLTGYADLDAIEGSINEGEVYRFLTKPCAPEELRDTVRQASVIAREQAVAKSAEVEAAIEARAQKEVLTVRILPPDAAPKPRAAAIPAGKPAIRRPDAAAAPKAAPKAPPPRAPAPATMLGDETLPDIASALQDEAAPRKPESRPVKVPVRPAAEPAPRKPESRPVKVPARPAAEPAAPVAASKAPVPDEEHMDMTETIVMEGDGFQIMTAGGAEKSKRKAIDAKAGAIGVLVFSNDNALLQTVKTACADEFLVAHATNIVRVTKLLTAIRPGILVTDISDEAAVIERLVSTLKQHLPELVTLVVGQHRDTVGLVNLINFGQVFRFLRKPLAPGPCQVSIRAAARKHAMLRKNPDLIKRHAVNAAPETHEDGGTGKFGGVIDRLRNVRKRWVAS